jgi:hypothetical protein
MKYLKTYEQLSSQIMSDDTIKLLVSKDGKWILKGSDNYYGGYTYPDGTRNYKDAYYIWAVEANDDIFEDKKMLKTFIIPDHSNIDNFFENGFYKSYMGMNDDNFIGYYKYNLPHPDTNFKNYLEDDNNKIPYTKDDFEVVEYSIGYIKDTEIDL